MRNPEVLTASASARGRFLYWFSALHISNKIRYWLNERSRALALLNSPLVFAYAKTAAGQLVLLPTRIPYGLEVIFKRN